MLDKQDTLALILKKKNPKKNQVMDRHKVGKGDNYVSFSPLGGTIDQLAGAHQQIWGSARNGVGGVVHI